MTSKLDLTLETINITLLELKQRKLRLTGHGTYTRRDSRWNNGCRGNRRCYCLQGILNQHFSLSSYRQRFNENKK